MAEDNQGEKSRNMVPSASFIYSDVSSTTNSNIQSQIPSFEGNPEMFSLTADMEMIGFPQKNLQQQQTVMWKGLLGKGGGGGCSKTADDFYDQAAQEFNNSTTRNENLMVAPAGWQVEESRLMVDDPSSLRCTVFPCEGNERPSQGLSLSLSSANPSTIGLQSFQLRHQQQQGDDDDAAADHMRFFPPPNSTRDAFFGKSAVAVQVQEQEDDGGWFLQSKAANQGNNNLLQLRSSKYLAPAQQLLQEFCNLGTNQLHPHPPPTKHQKSAKTNQWEDENGTTNTTTTSSSSSRKPSLYSLELVELQKRKSKLLSMLEEVDKRYKHYCDQMKAVVSSFESVAGNGAARVYSALASKAMSRHFRCLRDGVVSQIHATKKAMGEKDPVAPGTSRGETPRLRLLDQALRQQRAFQQMSMMESHPWRPQRGLPERSVSVLRAWLFEHFLHPYPSDVDKHILARQTGLSRSQVSNWFINARVRLWKPMVEEMYMEETKEVELDMSPGAGSQDEPPVRLMPEDDQKPTAEQLVRIDSECLSSIINHPPDKSNNSDSRNGKSFQNHSSFGRVADAFGAMELDFSSNYHGGVAAVGGGAVNSVSFTNHGSSSSEHHQNFSGGGGGVSLTLGLQQHGGVSLAFSPPSHNSALFYPRDPIDDCQSVQYSLLDGEAHNLPYRNLMGAQLLHDLAG